MEIDLFADIACPWCYIGERRLKRAVEEAGVDAKVRWRPFQLQPDLPAGGVPWREFVDHRFGGWERARGMFAHVAAAGAADGIRFDFEGMPRAPNTRDAHRLMLLANDVGLVWEMAEALFAAYFTEARDVTDAAVLAELAAGAGLPAERVREVLQGESYAPLVDDSQREAREKDITGVPFIVFGERFAVSGAQPPEVFRTAIERAAG